MDEELAYTLTEEELIHYYLLDMLDTIISQMVWMKELVEQELDRIADEAQ